MSSLLLYAHAGYERKHRKAESFPLFSTHSQDRLEYKTGQTGSVTGKDDTEQRLGGSQTTVDLSLQVMSDRIGKESEIAKH